MIVLGQTLDDGRDVLLDGPGSVDILYNEILINSGIPPTEVTRIVYSLFSRSWYRSENLNQLSGPGNEWRSLIIME